MLIRIYVRNSNGVGDVGDDHDDGDSNDDGSDDGDSERKGVS